MSLLRPFQNNYPHKSVGSLRLLVVAFVGLLLSSCCTPGVKPEDANLFQAMCGLSSGAFKEQTSKRQEEAASSKSAVQQEQQQAEVLRVNLVVVEQERAELHARLASIDQENKVLERQVAGLREGTAAEQQIKKKRQQEFLAIKQQIRQARQQYTPDQTATDGYAAEVEKLEREVKTLRAIILSP